MSTRNDGGPAFPLIAEAHEHVLSVGVTLRDHFATHAPPVPSWWHGGDVAKAKDMAEWAWWYADAMLKARES